MRQIKINIIIAFFLIGILSAYSININIKGKVVDYITLKPVSYINVFISGTTYGTISNLEGEFNLELDNLGVNVLVVKGIGYQSTTIALDRAKNQHNILVKVKPKAYGISEVNVAGHDPNKEHKFNIFKNRFLGSSRNARSCEILNANTLHLVGNYERGNVFKKWYLNVSADSFLVIKNEKLGYDITYDLVYFKANAQGASFMGYPLFKDRINKCEDSTLIMANRINSYAGSKLHFFRALYCKQLDEAGFKVYKVKPKALSSVKKSRKYGHIISESLSGHPDTCLFQTDDVLNLYRNLDIDTVSNSAILNTDAVFEVRYLRQSEEMEYQRCKYLYEGIKRKRGSQISIVKLKNGNIKFFQNGSIENSDELTTYGYWSYKQLGDLVPANFNINVKK